MGTSRRPPPVPPRRPSKRPASASKPPASASKPPKTPSIVPLSTHEEGPREAPAVLVVDDDDAARRLIVRALRTAFTVYEAADGEAAVEVLQRAKLACVVTDIMMPRLDGLALAKKMRAEASQRAIPVVFVTGRGDSAVVLDGINVGAKFVLQKPFKVRELVDKVRGVVQRAE